MQPSLPLQRWLSSSAGQLLLQQEHSWNGELLKRLYGVHLMQLGLAKENYIEQATGMHHTFVMDLDAHEEQSWAVVEGHESALPIATESLSAVILPHVLEFSSDPHQLLREVTRVLTEDGSVVIYGFSPWGALNLGRRIPSGRYLSAGKVSEWLALLGYELVQQQQLPLLGWSWSRSRLNSGAYQLVARRRVVPLNPIRSRWQRNPVVATRNMVNSEYGNYLPQTKEQQ
ncbi:MAG: methyltransferase domain-containing protein [Gammaproteobacteria bacterium]|jgi:SAM-dependent methyltransferase|nr:methyltransferase domain-containing protein [Gammaproteobacteria bacterium]